MNKLLVICGPTAVGKTDLALKLAPKLHGDIIAADSRQVFKGMDIGTGKDYPPADSGVALYGVDLTTPDQPFSATQYARSAQAIIEKLWQEKRLPILTVGTGFYLKALLNPPATAFIPPNLSLRHRLETLPLSKLCQELQTVDSIRWQKMNHSDRSNPRRLIRAIEVASSRMTKSSAVQPFNHISIKYIGLTAPFAIIKTRIDERVLNRASSEFSKEIQVLLNRYPNFFTLPASSATGYQEWGSVIQGKRTPAEAISLWQTAERQYAKRQLTWFKPITEIQWFDTTDPNYVNDIEALLCTW